ncbi:hypothetical protein DL96DRAFT_1676271 [Flagelloscypha sp. PMI_526]|nr:hypothetical protein DL96DRAFT_1676271 [Flagelloscypha sp. PMI_526]
MSQPPRKRRQSYHQLAANPLIVAPYSIPSPPSMILSSHLRPQNPHMVPPMPKAQSHSIYPPPPRTQPHHIYPPQPCTTPLPTDFTRYPQSQTPRLAAPKRSRSQPPSGRMSTQLEVPPTVPRVPSRHNVPPPVTTSPQTVPLRVEKQLGVTNWCTKLMNFSKMLGKKMSYDAFEDGPRHNRVWVVRYFLDDIEYSEYVDTEKDKAKQGAAYRAYTVLSGEQEGRYQSLPRY